MALPCNARCRFLPRHAVNAHPPKILVGGDGKDRVRRKNVLRLRRLRNLLRGDRTPGKHTTSFVGFQKKRFMLHRRWANQETLRFIARFSPPTNRFDVFGRNLEVSHIFLKSHGCLMAIWLTYKIFACILCTFHSANRTTQRRIDMGLIRVGARHPIVTAYAAHCHAPRNVGGEWVERSLKTFIAFRHRCPA